MNINCCNDCFYWDLSPIQGAHYHYRLANYYAKRAKQYSEKAIKYRWLSLIVSALFLLQGTIVWLVNTWD